MNRLILITSDPFVESVLQGIQEQKPHINYWTNGVLPEQPFLYVDIWNGDKLVIRAQKKCMEIDTLHNSYARYHPSCGGMLASEQALSAFLQQIFGETPDPIGNIILEDCLCDPNGLPCEYTERSTGKFTFI